MRVLITRPAEDAPALAGAVRARGHEPLIAPLSIIRYETPAAPPLEAPAATIFTSRNAVRALERCTWARDLYPLPAYCVGAATAQAARKAGFTHVIGGGGTGAQLAEHIAYVHAPEAGPLLYLTGDHLAFDMQAALGERGLSIRREIVYRSELVRTLPDEALAALRESRLDAVVLMSPRAAAHFVHLVQRAALSQQAARLQFFCLSEQIEQPLGRLGAGRITIAAHTTQAALLDLLGPRTLA